MQEIVLTLVPVAGSIAVAFIANYFTKNKRQDLLSEEIEETINPDGSRIKKEKRKYK